MTAAPDFQILLLPRADYWAWLRACRDYAITFGANLTSDPTSAAGYMRPSQVVSFPQFDGAFPDLGNPIRWFRAHYDGIRLDPIEAAHPRALKDELKRRIDENDRYGARRRPFFLQWPTDYPVVTQPFGVNPQIYRRYGMPGHEGIDVRALTNTPIYACADGEVYEVYRYPSPHPYGIHVRIHHQDGYKTVYAHLARPLVREGDVVRAGQVIGRADSTGNSSASHLHLSLKRDGATARGETTYPKDILDPTPFLVWPARPKAKALDPRSETQVGLNLATAGGLEHAVRLSADARVDALMIGTGIERPTIDALRRGYEEPVRLIVRWTDEPGWPREGPARFVAQVAAEAGRLYRIGVRDFEPVLFPNEFQGGFGTAWRDGAEFAAWFVEVRRRWRSLFPEARIGFPALAPGGNVRGRQQAASSFLEQAADAALEADWIGIACDLDGAAESIARCRAAFPQTPWIVTDLRNPADDASGEVSAIRFVAACRDLDPSSGAGAVLFDPTAALADPSGRSARETASILARRDARQMRPTGPLGRP